MAEPEAPPVTDPAELVALARAAVEADPAKPELKLDLALALVTARAFEEAESILEALPANLGADPKVGRARSRMAFGRLADSAPSRTALEALVAKDADAPEPRLLLGVRLIVDGAVAEGLDQLLALLKSHRQWEEGRARRTLVDAFSVIEDEDLVRAYRRKMTALLF